MVFYTEIQKDVSDFFATPECFAIFTDGKESCEFQNLLFANLNLEWAPFDDPVGGAPNLAQSSILATSLLKMHVKYFDETAALARRPLSKSGAAFDMADFFVILKNVGAGWPKVRAALLERQGWTSFPDVWHDTLELVDTVAADNGKLMPRWYNLTMEVFNSRPMTLLHGDFHAGNQWMSKADPSTFLIADWQLMRMGPIGLDLSPVFMGSDLAENGESDAFLRTYCDALHAACPAAKAAYPYEALVTDVTLGCVVFAVTIAVFASGTLDESLPQEKQDFFWKSWWPLCFRRLSHVINRYGGKDTVLGLLRSGVAPIASQLGPRHGKVPPVNKQPDEAPVDEPTPDLEPLDEHSASMYGGLLTSSSVTMSEHLQTDLFIATKLIAFAHHAKAALKAAKHA